MANPSAAMIVIGDEILSGRTRDINAHVLAEALAARGIDLVEVRMITDDHARIVATVQDLSAMVDHVFTSGGIGPTHDDITADAVAAAFGTQIEVRADARAILEAFYAERDIEMNAARLRMARIPDGATLIDNPVSKAPGFSLQNVHVMAGVPKIFSAMLDGLMPSLSAGTPVISETIRVERPEGEVAAHVGAVAEAHPEVSVGCYPFNENGKLGCNLVLRGFEPAALKEAASALTRALS